MPSSVTSEPAPGADATSLLFDFRSGVFKMTGGVFRRDANGSGVVFCFALGNVTATCPVTALRTEFNIVDGTEDAALLAQVSKALKYLKEVRPGDSIPWEIIDGRASWMVDEKYLAIAKARLTIQLTTWLRSVNSGSFEVERLNAGNEGLQLARVVQSAFGDIARELGYGPDRKQEVVDHVERLALELAYIEALRGKFMDVRRLMATLRSLYSSYKGDRATQEMVTRCTALLTKPVENVLTVFDTFDANTGELLPMLKHLDAQVTYIRQTRNELREAYLVWEELIQQWDSVQPQLGANAERAIRETYHFAARHFPAGVPWSV
jgi:hypothetical protein